MSAVASWWWPSVEREQTISPIPKDVEIIIENIHKQNKDDPALKMPAVIAATGSAGQAVAWLLGVPGASYTVLEAIVPYAKNSLKDYLHVDRDVEMPAVTAEVSQNMAEEAYERARNLTGSRMVVGLGVTAAVGTINDRRGKDQCFVTVRSDGKKKTWHLELNKEIKRFRIQHDVLVSRLVIRALAWVNGFEEETDVIEMYINGKDKLVEFEKSPVITRANERAKHLEKISIAKGRPLTRAELDEKNYVFDK